MAAHAKFSPSKMQRTMACNGAPAMESQFPDSRNDYADEGTAAHHISGECLTKNLDASEFIGMSVDVDKDGNCKLYPDDSGKFQIDEDFADAVQVYLDIVRRYAHGNLLLVEQRVEFSQAVGVPDQFGTSDCVIIDSKNKHLIVGDLKFGRGVKVFAENNEQMLTYAAGVMETFADLMPKIEKVTLFISQPRIDHYDPWECTLQDVLVHIHKMRKAVDNASLAQRMLERNKSVPRYLLNPGKKQCTFCKAEGTCPARAQWVAEQVTADFAALDNADTLAIQGAYELPSVELLAARYAILDQIESWISAVRTEVDRMVHGGMEVIGPDGLRMKLVAGKAGNRKWKDEKKAEATLAGHLTPDDMYEPRKVVSVAVAEKKLKKTSATWKAIAELGLWESKPGNPTVALGSDDRPEWVPQASADDFADLTVKDDL